MAETIPEPENGWLSWISLPEDYEEPQLIQAPVFRAGTTCVTDGRPRLDAWCEERRYAADGTPQGVVEPEWTSVPHEAGTYERKVRRNSIEYDEEWTYDDRGNLIEWKQRRQWLPEPLLTGHWRLRFTCDGRPAHYVTEEGDILPFLYDHAGRLTKIVRPYDGAITQAWDPNGQLRARKRVWSSNNYYFKLEQLFDHEGREIARRDYESNSMFDKEITHVRDLDEGRTRILLEEKRRQWRSSSVSQNGVDGAGRAAFTWTARVFGFRPDSSYWNKYGEGPPEQTHAKAAIRTTFSCDTGEPVKIETDDGMDGTVDEVVTYEWLEREQIIRQRTSTKGTWSDFHYRCD